MMRKICEWLKYEHVIFYKRCSNALAEYERSEQFAQPLIDRFDFEFLCHVQREYLHHALDLAEYFEEMAKQEKSPEIAP